MADMNKKDNLNNIVEEDTPDVFPDITKMVKENEIEPDAPLEDGEVSVDGDLQFVYIKKKDAYTIKPINLDGKEIFIGRNALKGDIADIDLTGTSNINRIILEDNKDFETLLNLMNIDEKAIVSVELKTDSGNHTSRVVSGSYVYQYEDDVFKPYNFKEDDTKPLDVINGVPVKTENITVEENSNENINTQTSTETENKKDATEVVGEINNNKPPKTQHPRVKKEVKKVYDHDAILEQTGMVYSGTDEKTQAIADKLNDLSKQIAGQKALFTSTATKLANTKRSLYPHKGLRNLFDRLIKVPIIGLFRLFMKLIGKGDSIVYNETEATIRELKNELKEIKKNIVECKALEKEIKKTHKLDIETVHVSRAENKIKEKTNNKPKNESKKVFEENSVLDEKPLQNTPEHEYKLNKNAVFKKHLQDLFGTEVDISHQGDSKHILDVNIGAVDDDNSKIITAQIDTRKGNVEITSSADLTDAQKNDIITKIVACHLNAKIKCDRDGHINKDFLNKKILPKTNAIVNGEKNSAKIFFNGLEMDINKNGDKISISCKNKTLNKEPLVLNSIPKAYLQEKNIEGCLLYAQKEFVSKTFREFVDDNFKNVLSKSELLKGVKIKHLENGENNINVTYALPGDKNGSRESVATVSINKKTLDVKCEINTEDVAGDVKHNLNVISYNISDAYLCSLFDSLDRDFILPDTSVLGGTFNELISKTSVGKPLNVAMCGAVCTFNRSDDGTARITVRNATTELADVLCYQNADTSSVEILPENVIDIRNKMINYLEKRVENYENRNAQAINSTSLTLSSGEIANAIIEKETYSGDGEVSEALSSENNDNIDQQMQHKLFDKQNNDLAL